MPYTQKPQASLMKDSCKNTITTHIVFMEYRYQAEHNQQVKNYIMERLNLELGNQYSPKRIKR